MKLIKKPLKHKSESKSSNKRRTLKNPTGLQRREENQQGEFGNEPMKYNKGKDSGIHIKKKNRGKFTAAAKRAGMGVQEYARKILKAPKGKYSSTLRKRANFAANAAKWH